MTPVETSSFSPPDVPSTTLNAPAYDEFKDRRITDWKRVRACLEHENTLLNQRFTWLLLSQGFLFTAAGAIYKSYADILTAKPSQGLASESIVLLNQHEAVILLIAVLAVAVCIFLWRGMYAAHRQHDRLTAWWRDQFDGSEQPEKRHPWISGSEPNLGISLHYHALPLVFGFAWIVIIFIGAFRFLYPFLGVIMRIFAAVAVPPYWAWFSGWACGSAQKQIVEFIDDCWRGGLAADG